MLRLPPERVTAVGSGMGAIEPYDDRRVRQTGPFFVAKHLFQAKGGLCARGVRVGAPSSARSDADVVGDERSRAFVGDRPGITFHAHLPWNACSSSIATPLARSTHAE